jgi:hypothetical protein
MIGHATKLSTQVIPSVAKDLPQTFLITLRSRRETSSVGEVPHSVRDDQRSTQNGVRFTPCT